MKIKYLKQKYSYVKTFILWSIDVLRIFGRLKEVTVQKCVVQQVLHYFAQKKMALFVEHASCLSTVIYNLSVGINWRS